MPTRIEFFCKNYRDFHGKNYRKHWNRGTPDRSGTFYGAHRKISRDVTVKISGFKRLVHNYLIAFVDALFNCLSILFKIIDFLL